MRQTLLLRVLLVMFLVGLLLAGGLLYVVSSDAAADYPELVHGWMRINLAVVAGLLPVVVAVQVVIALLRVVDQADAFSTRTLVLLRRLFAGALELRQENELTV